MRTVAGFVRIGLAVTMFFISGKFPAVGARALYLISIHLE